MAWSILAVSVQRAFSILIMLGIILWVYLLWQRAHPVERIEQIVGEVDDAEVADRCAKYRMNDDGDESTWSLGYEGRIRQLVHGCF